VEKELEPERRISERSVTTLNGSIRLPGRIARHIKVLDLSTDGCSIETAVFVMADQLVWVRLPGLESWESTVAWVKEGLAGLKFKYALHPAVVASLVERQKAQSNATVIGLQKVDRPIEPINVRARLRRSGSEST
jgi:hypothetical protein